MLKLTHYTFEKFVFNPRQEYRQSKSALKPDGLWLSHDKCGAGWLDWCMTNAFMEHRLNYETEIHIEETDKDIAFINDDKSMWAFQYKYSAYIHSLLGIDFKRVASDYKALVIIPYLYKFRLHSDFLWYYGWDCASACVWDLSCIKFIGESKRRVEGEQIGRVGQSD